MPSCSYQVELLARRVHRCYCCGGACLNERVKRLLMNAFTFFHGLPRRLRLTSTGYDAAS